MDKKLVKSITSRDEDFTQWYTDIVKKAELSSYSSVRGCMVVRPYATALWENIKADLDRRFKELGHVNVMMPMFIPESLLQKEKDHVEGFAPEVAWVTYGGDEKLTERLCVRPTSETLFCDHYHDIIHSYRDLPKLYNQWCSVVRWEKTTRPFLRTMEFFWQEGHTMHETSKDAVEETEQMLNVYADFVENALSIPVIKGIKTDKEKFAGAEKTYTIEALMHDGKALQSATSHYFGDGFSRAFDIKFADRENGLSYPFQTSWGMSSRIIGAIIMTHGDDDGLVLPVQVAPIQIVIVPIAPHKGNVLKKAEQLKEKLSEKYRVKLDDSDNTPGWKFAEYEMKGVPLRIEIGPKDIEKNQAVMVKRYNREKLFVSLDEIESEVEKALKDIQKGMYENALNRRTQMTYTAHDYDEFKKIAEEKSGLIKAMWCGDLACEEKIKDETSCTSRCIPFDEEHISDTCVCCGKKAKSMLYFGKAY